MLRAGLYARVSTNDQQTLAMQNRTMREYAARRGWTIALQVREVNTGAARREAREKVLEAAPVFTSRTCRAINTGAARREAREKVLEAARRPAIDLVLV